MPVLTIRRGNETRRVQFLGEMPLQALLSQEGLLPAEPCGGRGSCGKCAVQLSGAVSAPNEQEQKHGVRLACQARVFGDAVVILPIEQRFLQIEIQASAAAVTLHPMPGRLGLAVDIGTTTLAAQLYDLKTGTVLAGAGLLNPQTQVAADVMGRIGAAMQGQLPALQQQVRQAIEALCH